MAAIYAVSASIAAISDTAANISAGITVGENAAQALITARANDGLLASIPYTPLAGLGFWQPTPPAFGPAATPWLIAVWIGLTDCRREMMSPT